MKTTPLPIWCKALVGACFAAAALTAPAQSALPPSAQVQALLRLHYSGYGTGGDPAAIFQQTALPTWSNCSANGASCQSREELAGLLSQGLHKVIPDMKWEILEMMASGDKVIVRGQGSGTPAGTFMGMPATGKSFKVMSIDIHTLQDGKIVHTHHLEDWPTALKQLSAR